MEHDLPYGKSFIGGRSSSCAHCTQTHTFTHSRTYTTHTHTFTYKHTQSHAHGRCDLVSLSCTMLMYHLQIDDDGRRMVTAGWLSIDIFANFYIYVDIIDFI